MSLHQAHLNIIADDAAQSSNIDSAIRDLAIRGILTGVAAFANFGRLPEQRMLASLGVKIGIHLNISSGRPLSQPDTIASLVDAEGNFRSPRAADSSPRAIADAILSYQAHHLSNVEETQVIAELQTQIGLFEQIIGQAPAFVAIHHDLDRDERLQAILTRTFPNLPGRQQRVQSSMLAGYFYIFLSEMDTLSTAIQSVRELILQAVKKSFAAQGRPSEIVCHPGHVSPPTTTFTVYNQQRQQEYEAWRSNSILSLLRRGSRLEDEWIFNSNTRFCEE